MHHSLFLERLYSAVYSINGGGGISGGVHISMMAAEEHHKWRVSSSKLNN